MRKIKSIKRKNFLFLNLLLCISIFLFYETHPASFFKEFATRRLEEFFPEGTKVDIGNIKGGIFRNIVSEDVRIYPRKENATASFNIEQIELDYKLWYPVFKKIPALRWDYDRKKIMLLVGNKKTDFMSGFFEVEFYQGRMAVEGYLDLNNKNKFFIKGNVEKEKPSRFYITQEKGSIDLEIDKKIDKFLINGKINHINPAQWLPLSGVKLQDIDFIGDCNATIYPHAKGFGVGINTDITFKDIIINYMPFDKRIEFSLSYDRTKEILNVTRFKVDDEIEGQGYLRLTSPRYLFLKWRVRDLILEDYFPAYETFEEGVSGTMNGNFTLKGPIKEACLSAHLDIQNGNLGNMRFDSIIANLKGEGPLISIYDSRIRKEGGYMILGGEVDLTKLKDNKAFDSVLLTPDENFFVWEEWSIKKEHENSSVKAEKFLDEEFQLSFKAYREDAKSEEEHFLGVEHKVKF